LSDGGGEFFAARVPIVGREKILTFYSKLAKYLGSHMRVEVRMLNGLPALITENSAAPPGYAPRTALLFGVDGAGQLNRFYSILATRKLRALS